MKSGPNRFAWLMRPRLDVLRKALDYEPRIFSGEAGLVEIACLTNVDMVLVAIVGTGGLRPALAAIKAGKDLAVASKEILVMAGEIVMREARDNSVHVLPVDSEHNAIFQCLEGKQCEQMSEGSSLRRLAALSAKHREQDSIRLRRSRP